MRADWFRYARRVLSQTFGAIVSPSQSTLTYSAWANTADGATATTLTFTAKDASGNTMSNVPLAWSVRRVTLSDADSAIVSVNPSDIASDGVETATITAQVLHSVGGEMIPVRGVPAANVVLAVSGTGNTLTQPASATNYAGVTTGTIKSTQASATKSVSQTVLGIAMVQTETLTTDGSYTPPAGGSPFFEEDFIGGVKHPANGFTWATTNSTVAVSTDQAHSGTHSLRFRYTARATGLASSNSPEQRFNMGQDLSEVWIEYWLHVPSNYVHRSDGYNQNNKFFMIWNTVYGSGSGTWQAGYEYWRTDNTHSWMRPMSSKEFGTNALNVESSGLGHPNYGDALIGPSGPIVIGSWNQIRLYFKRSSASGATDGIMKMWVGGTLIASMTNGPFRNYNNVGETVLRNGYFLGTANSGFAEQTDFHIDDVKFYNTDPGW